MAAQTFREREKKNKVVSFSTLSLMLFLISTLTWVTEKELEPVIENKVEEFRWEKT